MLENTLPKDLVKMTDLQFYLSHGLTPFWCEKAFLCLLTGGKIDAESVLGNIATFNLEDQKLVFGACKSWPGSSFCQQNYSAENLCEGCFDFPFILKGIFTGYNIWIESFLLIPEKCTTSDLPDFSWEMKFIWLDFSLQLIFIIFCFKIFLCLVFTHTTF